jgi:hypothetical protein
MLVDLGVRVGWLVEAKVRFRNRKGSLLPAVLLLGSRRVSSSEKCLCFVSEPCKEELLAVKAK